MTRWIVAATLLCVATAPAFGDTLVMSCKGNSCQRSRCDDWRENCSVAGYFQKTANGNYVVPQAHQTCNEFGDCNYGLPRYPKAGDTKSASPARPLVLVPR